MKAQNTFLCFLIRNINAEKFFNNDGDNICPRILCLPSF